MAIRSGAHVSERNTKAPTHARRRTGNFITWCGLVWWSRPRGVTEGLPELIACFGDLRPGEVRGQETLAQLETPYLAQLAAATGIVPTIPTKMTLPGK